MENDYLDPLNDGKSRISLKDRLGNDLSVVNDARASFEKESEILREKDIKLLKFLIEHKHWSPTRGVVFKFKVKAPLYVCRQFWKHIVASNHNDEQLQHNEKSFRYVQADDPDEFYIPQSFRKQAKNNKQATYGALDPELNTEAIRIYGEECRSSYNTYAKLLNLGVGREQARGVLVPSIYTSWVWTTSLQSALHFISLRRLEGSPQAEIAEYAKAVEELISPYVPYCIKFWLRPDQD